MKFKKKQWVSILLIVTMLFIIMPVGVFAETGLDAEPVLLKEEFASVSTCEAPAVSLFTLDSNGSVALKDGQYEQWIDRLDLTGNDYAKSFYNWMETTNALITPESAEQLASGEYVYRVTVFDGTSSFTYTGDSETDAAAIMDATSEELELNMMETFAYIDAAFSAFCRDHAEVFWLSDTIEVISECSYAYSSTGVVEYTQDIYFVLKSANFDIRAEEYRSAEVIQSAINQRDAAVDEITAAVSGSRYEKLVYFNEWLTTHNSYNSNAATAGKEAHECISALSGSTGAEGPVCEGYASAMKVLCDAVGIPCILVDGIADNMSGNTEGHMWNYVQMEDGNWYAVDVTWNDPSTGSNAAVSGAEHTGYLLLGSNTVINDNGMTFADTHTIFNTVTECGTAFINGPVLAEEAYEYDVNIGENDDNSNIVISGTWNNGNGVWNLDQDGVLTLSGKGEVIPEVASFDISLDDIKSVIIEDGVIGIGFYAFEGCNNLTSVTIPDSLTSIDHGAFYNCSRLSNIIIPAGVTSIGDSAFWGCSGLISIIVPDGVTNIGECVFYNCNGLNDIVIPDSITGIDDYAFYGCSKLTSLTIPEDVTRIGEWAFCGCTGLTSIIIPDGVTNISKWAFYNCNGLRNIIIPDSVISIDYGAFYGCSGLTSITISDGVTRIGEWAFYGCGNLASITIPDSVTSIGEYVFSDCYELTKIIIPDRVTSIGLVAFSNCDNLTIYGYSNSYAETYANENDIPFVALDAPEETIETIAMHRLYNPNSGEHFYTGSIEERDILVRAGWKYEGVAWNAPTQIGEYVHRLFNPNNGDHHYTMSLEERDTLVGYGWQYEGIAWNSAGAENMPQYRLYNPNADCGSHHYTGSEEERDWLVSLGWRFEGIGWFGIR